MVQETTIAARADLNMLSPVLRRLLATIPGEISEREGLGLAWLAAQVPPGRCIVEIGAYRGRSACHLAEGARWAAGAAPPALVFSVDLWQEAPWEQYADPANRQAFDDAIMAFALDECVVALQGQSAIIGPGWSGPPVGLLFLDGDHTFEAVAADYRAWQIHIASGGFLALHDAVDPDWGVRRAIEEIILPTGLWEPGPFISGDLAVLVRRVDP
jgi:hypothetical protein